MGESLADVLLKTADVLHWLGKYEACNTLILLSRLLRANDVRTLEQLETFVESTEGLADVGAAEQTGSATRE